MAGAHLETQARLVISGLDEAGRSTIVSDGNSSVRVATPGFTVCELWQVDRLPVPVLSESTLGREPVIAIFAIVRRHLDDRTPGAN